MGRRRTRSSSSDFGVFLDRQLAQRGLSAVGFAERAGLSASHVYQLLRGDRCDPRGTTLRKVATALGMPESELTGGGTENGAQAWPGTPVDKATFFTLMSAFPTGVTIVATLDEDGEPRGLTCTAISSVSADPPLLLVCIDRQARTLPALRYSRRFVVNYLLAGRGELSNKFARYQPDKWVDTAWRPTRSGMPWLHADTLAYAECSLVQELPAGDHVICVGRVDGGQPPAPGTQPLVYFRRGYATVPD